MYSLGPYGHQFKLNADFGTTNATDGSFGLYCGTQPGPYDDALAWPFSQSFTLTLVGRGGSGLDCSERVTLPANAGGGFNKGSVFKVGDDVCTLAELQAGGYIQNDSLLVRVTFEEA